MDSFEGEKHADIVRERYESTDNYNYFKDVVEEEYDLSDQDDELREMADATIKAANIAEVEIPDEVKTYGMATPIDMYEIDKISEKDEESESDDNLSSGGPGNDTTAKK